MKNSVLVAVSRHKDLENGGFMEIETIALDSFLSDKKIDAMKIDTGGAETLVLEGAKKLLEQKN